MDLPLHIGFSSILIAIFVDLVYSFLAIKYAVTISLSLDQVQELFYWIIYVIICILIDSQCRLQKPYHI